MEQWIRTLNSGSLYNPNDPELLEMQRAAKAVLNKYNGTGETALFEKMFAKCGTNITIERPFLANWGGKFMEIGDNFYANFNLVVVDDAKITIGNDVLIGPNVTLTTGAHPLDPETRKKGLQYSKPIKIGNNVWLGANVTVFPGVTIGNNTVVGAGSLVTKDLPDNVLAYGSPARIIKSI